MLATATALRAGAPVAEDDSETDSDGEGDGGAFEAPIPPKSGGLAPRQSPPELHYTLPEAIPPAQPRPEATRLSRKEHDLGQLALRRPLSLSTPGHASGCPKRRPRLGQSTAREALRGRLSGLATRVTRPYGLD